MTRALPHPLAVEDVAIDALHPDPGNPRRIADAELEALTRSIQRFGLVEPILVRREGRRVIGGHQRLVAARRLGLTTVPVIFLDISAERARVLNLALNKISDTWDEELLARLVAELNETPDVDCSLTGFGDAEIARLLRSLDAREKRERRASASTGTRHSRRWTRAAPGPARVTSGSSAPTACCAAMRRMPTTWPSSSTAPRRRWPSPTRRTTWPTAITARSNGAPASGGSRTTPCRLPSGTRSGPDGPPP